MIPIALVVLGPVGIYVGFGIQWLYQALYSFSPVLGGIVIGGLWGVCVIFGAHRPLLPIGLNDVAISGTNTLMCFAGSANFAQAGAALGVTLKSKSAETKQVAGAGALSAFLVACYCKKPAIYGVEPASETSHGVCGDRRCAGRCNYGYRKCGKYRICK